MSSVEEQVREGEDRFLRTLGPNKPIIGMLHLRGANDEERVRVAVAEIDQLIEGGVDAVLVENYFGSPEVVERVLAYLAEERTGVLYGVNVLDDFERTFEFADRYGARFVQLDAVAGHLDPAADGVFGLRLAELRQAIACCVLGGVRFKYQPVRSGRSLAEDLEIAKTRCDAVVVTGPGTGVETDIAKIAEFRRLLGDFPLLVGAGVTDENAPSQLAETDGAIVGSFFKRSYIDDDWVEPAHVQRFMAKIREIRGASGA